MRFRNYRGFTLLELLVVISILGFLLAAGGASYINSQRVARNARRVSDMKAIQFGLENYYSSHQSLYPYPDCGDAASLGMPAGIPTDPQPSKAYTFACPRVPASGVPDPDGSSYCVCADLEGQPVGNASSDICEMATGGSYYCVSNLQ